MSAAVLAAECPAGFPSKPINLLIGFGPGGGTDLIGRVVAAAIEQKRGWKVVVENRPGAGGGTMAVALKSVAPDGYTIGVAATDSVSLVPYTTPNSQYNFKDFSYPGSGMQINYGLVAAADRPYGSLEEFIAYAKKKGRATISTTGVAQDIIVKKIAAKFGANLVPIAGGGAAEAMTDALGGHVDAALQGTLHVEQIKSGKMRQLASLIDRRVPYAPDSKTLRESGLEYDLEGHTIFMTPKALPQPLLACLGDAIDEAIKSKPYLGLMTKLNNDALNLGQPGTFNHVERVAHENQEYFRK
jgi:tripartite-type tricarboxylate transporter receptor subunit TctC